jgi:hypothetical protein
MYSIKESINFYRLSCLQYVDLRVENKDSFQSWYKIKLTQTHIEKVHFLENEEGWKIHLVFCEGLSQATITCHQVKLEHLKHEERDYEAP